MTPPRRRPSRSSSRRGLSRPAVVLAVAGGGLAATAGLLTALAPEPLATGVSLTATAEDDSLWQGVATPLDWDRVVVMATGSFVATADEFAQASGDEASPAHFVIGRDGTIAITPRWREQRPPAAGWGTERSISVALLGDAADATDVQRSAAISLIDKLSRRLGPLQRG